MPPLSTSTSLIPGRNGPPLNFHSAANEKPLPPPYLCFGKLQTPSETTARAQIHHRPARARDRTWKWERTPGPARRVAVVPEEPPRGRHGRRVEAEEASETRRRRDARGRQTSGPTRKTDGGRRVTSWLGRLGSTARSLNAWRGWATKTDA